MLQMTIRCEVDGHEIARYEFNCTKVEIGSPPVSDGSAVMTFVPSGDVPHRMVLESVPAGVSKSIHDSTAETALREPPS